MQNIAVPWTIRFSSHIMKDTLFGRGIAVIKQSKSLVRRDENTLREQFILQTT